MQGIVAQVCKNISRIGEWKKKKLILLTENSSLDKKRLIDHIAEMLEIILGA